MALNTELRDSYNYGAQKSFNKRLKDLEGQYEGLKSEVDTSKIKAETAEIGEITSDKITVEDIEVNGTFKAEVVEAENIHTSGVSTTNIEANEANLTKAFIDALAAVNAVINDLTAVGLEADNANIKEASIKKLTVEDIIEKLNLNELQIVDKVALSHIAKTVLQIGLGYTDVDLSSTNRPKWNGNEVVTKEQLLGFTFKGKVETKEDLPDAEKGDVYLVEQPSQIFTIYDGENWIDIETPVIGGFRTAEDQDKIDESLQNQINDLTTESTELKQEVEDIKEDVETFKQNQQAIDQVQDEEIDEIKADVSDLEEQMKFKLTDAPAGGKVYGRQDNKWVDVDTDGIYVPKVYESISKYFTDINLIKADGFNDNSQTLLKDDKVLYLGLWNLSPSNNKQYTTKQMYDFVNDEVNKPLVKAEVLTSVNEAFENGLVLGLVDGVYNTLPFVDTETDFTTTIDGANIQRPDGDILGTNKIISDDNGVQIQSDIGFTANTPSIASDENSVINRRYIRDNLSLSLSSSNQTSAVLTHKSNSVDTILDKANTFIPNASGNYVWTQTDSNWMHRTKDYVYYKVDNVANQTANTISIWASIDKDGNTINMTAARDLRSNNVAGQSDFESWMTYHPDSWDGIRDNYAYWSHTNPTYGGYISIFNNGRFAGYVEDSSGNTEGLYTALITNQHYRWAGGKSLRGEKARILLVNNSATAEDGVKAAIIGIDSDGNEGLNKIKTFTLINSPIRSTAGIAAGKRHWFFHNDNTNTFTVVHADGTAVSYVLSDPTTNTQLSTAISTADNNFIELDNGDCIFAIRDMTNQTTYFIYCDDGYDEHSSEPFTVIKSDVDYTNAATTAGNVLAYGSPFVDFSNNVYFFPTMSRATADASFGFPVTVDLTSTYSVINKESKSVTSIKLPWVNSDVHASARVFKTRDPDDGQDYLWIFQGSYEATATAPNQDMCVVLNQSGGIQYINLGTGTSVHWFNNTANEGETKLGTYNRPTMSSSGLQWYLGRTAYSNIPYAAVTEDGIGIMVSNAGRDVCIFFGNGKFATYSYQSTLAGGPWVIPTTEGTTGPAMVAGKYGVTLYMRNSMAIKSTMADSTGSVIYIKPNADNPLGEPSYFYKPVQQGLWDNQFFRYRDGENYAESDFSNYKRKYLRTVTPLASHTGTASIGMFNYEIEDVTTSNTLYLKDGNDTISSVGIK